MICVIGPTILDFKWEILKLFDLYLANGLGFDVESAKTAAAAAAVNAAIAECVLPIGPRGETEAQNPSAADRSHEQPVGLIGWAT